MSQQLIFIIVAIVVGVLLLIAILAGDSDRERLPRSNPTATRMDERS